MSRSDVDYLQLFRALPTSYMVLDLDLVFVDANDAYVATTGRSREELVGRHVFELFPPTPDALDETGVPRVQRSWEKARDTGHVDTMPLQRYDIPDPVGGGMTERWWSLLSVPIAGPDGRVAFVAQRAEDVTDWVRERESGRAERERSERLGRRVQEVESDLYARAHELEAALQAQAQAAARVASLAAVAMELTGADSVDDLSRVVFGSGLPVLGADGGSIVVRDDAEQVVRLVISQELEGRVPAQYAVLPLDHPVPGAHVARTGEAVMLPTRASGLAWSDFMAEVYAATGRSAWAVLPLRVGDRLLGSLVASWVDERDFDADEVALLDGFAAQVSQALLRIQATEAERAAAAEAARLSEALQRSLLTDPPLLEDLSIAVRYQPAVQEAQVGGDWYDCFVTEAGATLLVVGDVGGHDRTAAAAMGQLRNLLRGIAYESDDSPAVLLSRLDRAMQGLGSDHLATAVLARVERTPEGHRLRWSSAGHLPPVLRLPDGALRVLDADGDLLLGLDRTAPRSERVTDLPVGTTVVLFTDGLVERRDATIDVGVQRVVDAIAEAGQRGPEAVADAVVAAADGGNEDDIAVLVLHVG